MEEINKFREHIDEIDKKIIKLILERSEWVEKIGKIKKLNKESIYRPDREKEIFENIKNFYNEFYKNKKIATPFPIAALFAIYKELMSGTIYMEGSPQIGFLGPEGSFSHMAVIKKFGSTLIAKPFDSIKDVFIALEMNDQIQYGVVPVENTIGGSIGTTLDEMVTTSLRVYSEIYVKVAQNLLAHEEIPLNKIKKIYTIPIARDQCSNWLNQNLNLKEIEFIETKSTAAASRLVKERRDGVAIASELSAKIYGLKIIAKNIQDVTNNITRFWVLTNHEYSKPTGKDKTSIIVGLHDKPGSLFRVLEPFYKSKINLTKIESRRTKRIYGEYHFFIDFEGHFEDKKIKKIMKILEERSSFLKVLGSYPKGEIDI